MSNKDAKPIHKAGQPPEPHSRAGLPKLTVEGEAVYAPIVSDLTVEERTVDICFVFDTTGSMSDKINGLINCMVELVGELAQLQLDWRITTVPFGDLTVRGDDVVTDIPFVSTRDAAQDLLRRMPRFSGGSNEGESSLEAMVAACNKDYRPEVAKVLVLLTDEPPLESWQLTVESVGQMIRQGEFVCFVAGPDPTYYGYRVQGFQQWAQENGGRWYPISQTMNTSEILAFLRSLIQQIARVADKVLEAGSVRRYLELEGGN